MLTAAFYSRGFGLWMGFGYLNTEPNRVFGAIGHVHFEESKLTT